MADAIITLIMTILAFSKVQLQWVLRVLIAHLSNSSDDIKYPKLILHCAQAFKWFDQRSASKCHGIMLKGLFKGSRGRESPPNCCDETK